MLALLAAAVVVCVGVDDTGRQAGAVGLFLEGKRLMSDARATEACPKFEAAQRAAPGTGIELNLADCWARIGRTASAWRVFHRLARELAATDRRAAYAGERAGELERDLARIRVRVREPVAGLVMRRDGEPTEAGPVPVDPGEHRITVSAPGHDAWTTTVTAEPGAVLVVDVPHLALRAGPAPQIDVAPVAVGRSRTRSWIAAGIAGAGVVSLAAAGLLLLAADAQYDAAVSSHCDEALVCDRTGVAAIHSARRKGDVATATTIAGVAAVAGGAILYLTAPRVRVAPVVAPGTAGLRVEGDL